MECPNCRPSPYVAIISTSVHRGCALVEEVGPFSEDDEEINLNNNNKDDVDEDDNQNLNIEPPSGIKPTYSMSTYMHDISTKKPSKYHKFGHLMDRPEESVYELRMLLLRMWFPNKTDVKVCSKYLSSKE